MTVADRDVPTGFARQRVAQWHHVVIIAMRVPPDFEIERRKRNLALVRDAEDRDVADLVKPAAQPNRIRRCRVVIAGQDHNRQPGIGEQHSGALDRRRRDLMVVEGVAGQDHDSGAELARGVENAAQPGRAVAAMHRRDAVVIDVEIGGMDEEDFPLSV